MTDKARELLELALRDWDSYEEPYFERLTITFEEIRAYLAEQKQYDALADRYVEGVTGGLEKCREYMDAQVWVAKELLSIREREVKREPLSDDEIEFGFLKSSQWGMEGCFRDGVRFAEKHHGIGGGE